MRLKYYLRGIGVGVIVTTILFMILISVSKNDATQQAPNQGGESKTIADFENDAQNAANTEAREGEIQPDDEPDTRQGEIQPDDEPDERQEDDRKADAPDAQPEASQPPQKTGKVRFIISGGEYSDVICQKLQEAGLIDDADAYNNFLVEENYDNFINPGVYDIPKNATYEEIAVLLTTKVE